MNQALAQRKETNDINKEKYYANILDSVSKGQKSLNANSSEQLIEKYNISANLDPRKINEILSRESINKILLKFIDSGQITEKDGQYFYQGRIFNQKQMKETIMNNFKDEIKELNKNEFNKIKLLLSKQSNNIKMQSNNEEKTAIANNINNLRNQLKKQEEVIEKKTQQYLNSLYKLNKAQAEQRKEMVQIEFNRDQQLFQQDILAAKDRQLAQGYENLQVQLNGQKLQIDQAKQQQDQHIQNLEAKYLSDLNKERREEQRQRQQMEEHKQIIDLQKDIANRAEQNFQNLINGAKANNEALINANKQNLKVQMDADAKLAKAQIQAAAKIGEQQKALNIQAAKAIIANQIKGDKAIAKGLQQLGANVNAIRGNFNNMNNNLDELNNNMENIGNKINKPIAIPPAPPGVLPLGCAGAPVPPTCVGSSWIQTPFFTNAVNKDTGKTGIEIYRCNWGGEGGAHYCASDGGSGYWDYLGNKYDNIPGWTPGQAPVNPFKAAPNKGIPFNKNLFGRNNNNLFGR